MPGERLPPLVVPIKSFSDEGGDTDRSATSGKKHLRKRKFHHGEAHDWDDASESLEGSRRQMFWMMIVGSSLFLAVVAWVVGALFREELPIPKNPEPARSETVAQEVAEVTLPSVPERSDASILEEAEPLVRRFLEATRIEDLLPLVRHPEVSGPRMSAHFPEGEIKAVGMAAFNTASQLIRRGSFVFIKVRTQDHEERSVVLVDAPEGLRIDWESWVGWSEMPWEEFIATKPASPKVFRVNLSPVEYFNFSFSDDAKWRSYRLESPDGEHALFGYVQRGTLLDSLLKPSPYMKKVALTLALSFPENATSGNQVLIDKRVAEGWVLETEETK